MSQLIVAIFTVLLAGCSTFSNRLEGQAREETSWISAGAGQELFRQTCQIGFRNKQVDGTVWLKTNSKKINGQFNAAVMAKSPDELKMEVSNFLGGTVALITIIAGHYEVTKGPGEALTASGDDSWGGIPLRWANELFLGKFPCPPLKESLKIVQERVNQLVVEYFDGITGSQKFIYKFKKIQNSKDGEYQYWPEGLHWEVQTTAQNSFNSTIDFSFDQPESETLSPLSWEAKSAEGTVKMRWKDRHRVGQD